MSINVPINSEIERVVLITIDCLRWDHHEPYKDLYPDGVWYRGTAQATFTAASHGSMFTGLNPPRSGVLDFGDTPVEDGTLFTATNHISHSKASNPNDTVIPGMDVKQGGDRNFLEFLDPEKTRKPEAINTDENVLRQLADSIESHDLTFLHDWSVHKSGPVHADNPTAEFCWPVNPDDGAEVCFEKYAKTVNMSVGAHSNLLAKLKERGLYENTLFVLWGDHGQALCEANHGNLAGHAMHAMEATARVPIAFLSTAFSEKQTDTEMNPRGVDILPTLASVFPVAGLAFDEPPQEFEGVDLTKFNGELVGYTLGRQTMFAADNDSVRSAKYAYLKRDLIDNPLDTTIEPSTENGFLSEVEVDNEERSEELKKMYNTVRKEPTKLIYRSDEGGD